MRRVGTRLLHRLPQRAARIHQGLLEHRQLGIRARELAEVAAMPDKATIERARRDKRQGKAPTTQAGEFVREEFEHVREGKHGARSPEQAIAIGLSKARRAGVDLPPPKKGEAKEKTRKSATRASEAGRKGRKRASPTRSRAVKSALKREGRSAASRRAV